MSIRKSLRSITGICLLATLVLACEKEMKDYSFIPDRQFTPGDVRATAGETDVLLSWNASLFAQGSPATYTVEIAKDSAFAAGPEFTLISNRPSITITDSLLTVRQPYFARVKANAAGATGESFYARSPSFSIRGEQIFSPVLSTELTDSSVILRWRATPNVTRIVITPTAGAPVDVPLLAADVAANQKRITGLTPLTQYTAEIFSNLVSKGTIIFTTPEKSIFTVQLSPGDDLVAAVANAASGDVIGLRPGTYDCYNSTTMEWSSLTIAQKSITIASVSNNPANTKVNYREITLKGSGAGVITRGITWDGLAAGTSSLYFLNLTGLNSDADPANFTSILVENCVVTNFGNCFLRGNRAANNAHKIDAIEVENSIVGDNRYLNAYTFFTMDKLEFKTLRLVRSTFYNIGRAFISFSTNIPLVTPPTITIDRCTINGFGRDARNNFFIDCNANTVNINVTNSIIANTPMPGQTTGTALVRAAAAVTATFFNNNSFNLSDGAAPVPADLTWPALFTMSNNKMINLGWAADAKQFPIPAGSELRTSSTTNGPIGDPRWTL